MAKKKVENILAVENAREVREVPEGPEVDETQNTDAARPASVSGLLFQAWLSLAVWMSLGLLLESLIGFRVPAYLNDPVRRELFRLAHTHGALLNIVLLLASLCIDRGLVTSSPAAIWALRIGAVLMPAGFLLGGIWHFEGEPGLGVWLVPLGGILVIFAVVNLAISALKRL